MNKSRIQKQKQPNRRLDPHLLAKLQASNVSKQHSVSSVVEVDTKPKPKPKPQTDEPKSLKTVGIHPLLMGNKDSLQASASTVGSVVPRNPLKASKRGFNVNPYMDPTVTPESKPHKRHLKFNEQGKYIAKANELREEQEAAQQEKLRQDELKARGLFPQLKLGENLYQPQEPPSIEWWDQPYLKDRNYDNIEDETRLHYTDMTEDNPITHYIQFPLLPKVDSGSNENGIKLYLTKKEAKKKRRVERLIKHKAEQEQIRAGLLPPPPPKIKLKNLMSVLTNEAIKDPTALNLKISSEIQQRQLQHEQMNAERKLSNEEKALKLQQKQEERIDNDGVYCGIFKVPILSNPYKVNVNAMQLGLKGCTVTLESGKTMIIVEGDYKNVEKYSKLLLNRIDWAHDKQGDVVSVPNNKCELVAKFKQKEFKFKKWFNKRFDNEEELIKFLQIFDIENYYRII